MTVLLERAVGRVDVGRVSVVGEVLPGLEPRGEELFVELVVAGGNECAHVRLLVA
jgi:hypothetical protein